MEKDNLYANSSNIADFSFGKETADVFYRVLISIFIFLGTVFLGFIPSNQIEVKQKDCYLINPSNNSSPVNNPT